MPSLNPSGAGAGRRGSRSPSPLSVAEEGKDESREELGMTWLVLGLGLGFCDTHLVHFSICACHPCTGAMLIFSVSFQFAGRIPFGLGFIGFRVGFRGSGLRVSALRN